MLPPFFMPCNTGDETESDESDESEPQPRQAKSRRVDYVMLCYYFINLQREAHY